MGKAHGRHRGVPNNLRRGRMAALRRARMLAYLFAAPIVRQLGRDVNSLI